MSGFGSDAVLWYSNIALVAVSGLVVIVSVVVGVVVGRCKVNSDCRSVQKFVLSLLVEAGIGAFLPGIIYSFVQVMRWEWLPQLCGGLTWSFTAVVFLQAATAASAILDRIYAVHWEFRYKYFVNQAQVRYHIGATAVACGFVGAVPTFLRDRGDTDHCQFLLYDFSFGYAAFAVAIYALLLVATFGGAALLCGAVRGLRAARHSEGVALRAAGSKFDGRGIVEHRSATGDVTSSTSKLTLRLEEGVDGSWERRNGSHGRGPEADGDAIATLDQWGLVVTLVVVDYLLFHVPLTAVSILGAVSLPTIAPYRTLVEHVAIWGLTAKGLLLAMIVILGDSRYRRFACSCKRRTASSPAMDEDAESEVAARVTYEDIGGGPHGFYLLSHGARKAGGNRNVLLNGNHTAGTSKLVVTPSFKVEAEHSSKQPKGRKRQPAGVDQRSKKSTKKQKLSKQMAGDIPALYAYVNKAFSGSEEDEDIEEATNKRAGSWMRRSSTLEDLNADMEGSWFDMEDRFPDQDSNSDMEDAAALSQTSDIAVVLNKSDSHHRMALYKLTADAEDVVRLFPPGRDADDDAAAAAPVYIIPVKNCGAMNIYRLALQEQLTMTGSAGNLTRGDAMLGSRDFSTLTTGIGSDDAESDDGREMALRRREVAPPVREAVRAAMIAELYADMAAEDGDDSGHETTVERIARGISCQGAPPRRLAYVGRRVSRRESVKRALCVADMLSRSAEDGSARSRELFVVGGGATQCHGKSNKDAWLLNWEKLLGKLTIPEEVLEKLRESCRRRDGEGLSAVSGADMTIGAYF